MLDALHRGYSLPPPAHPNPTQSNQGRMFSVQQISSPRTVWARARTRVIVKKKKKLTNQNSKPTVMPGGEFISPVMGQRPKPTRMMTLRPTVSVSRSLRFPEEP